MVWMFNDCWPTSNWALIDYSRREKPAYFAAKRACAPIRPIIMERGGRVEFFLGNDTLEACEAEVRYGQETLAGKEVLGQGHKLRVPPNSTHKFAALTRAECRFAPGDYLSIDAVANDRSTARSTSPTGGRGSIGRRRTSG